MMARSGAGGVLAAAAFAGASVASVFSSAVHADDRYMAPPSVGERNIDGKSRRGSDASGMVPITRDFLRSFYARFENPRISTSTAALRLRAIATSARLGRTDAASAAPRRIDQCMYAARCACEEAAEALRGEMIAGLAAENLEAARDRFLNFQQTQQEKASRMVYGFLPTDFRGRLFQAARDKGEQRNRAAVEELVARGGSIAEKYKLLWEQQWARRETLAMVGNASGVWRLVVRYLGGVPQPLLDFARSINQPDGPTEELRLKFGPVLEELVVFARELRTLAEAIDRCMQNVGDEEAVRVIEEAAMGFREEVDQFCDLLTEVVEKSPFFVSNEEIKAMRLVNGTDSILET